MLICSILQALLLCAILWLLVRREKQAELHMAELQQMHAERCNQLSSYLSGITSLLVSVIHKDGLQIRPLTAADSITIANPTLHVNGPLTNWEFEKTLLPIGDAVVEAVSEALTANGDRVHAAVSTAVQDAASVVRQQQRWSGPVYEILRHGKHHHWCEKDSRDYRVALQTPGLTVRHPDGTIEEGKK